MHLDLRTVVKELDKQIERVSVAFPSSINKEIEVLALASKILVASIAELQAEIEFMKIKIGASNESST